MLVLLNAHDQEVPFELPTTDEGKSWLRVIDTISATTPEQRWTDAHYPLQGRSVAVFALNSDRRDRRMTDPAVTP